MISYEFIFPGSPSDAELQVLRQRAERRKALQLMLRTGLPVVPEPISGTETALFENDSDYELIDDGDNESLNDIDF